MARKPLATYKEYEQLRTIMVEHNNSIVQTKDTASDWLEVLESKGLIHIRGKSNSHIEYCIEPKKYRQIKAYWNS